MQGVVKWFNEVKGFGFIQPDSGGTDDFVHISALERSGMHDLEPGDVVEYELGHSKNGRMAAQNLRLLGHRDVPAKGAR